MICVIENMITEMNGKIVFLKVHSWPAATVVALWENNLST